MFMRGTTKERPLTHDLMGHLMTALGARVERIIINDLKNATYYARMIIRAENELQQAIRISQELGERQLASWTWRALARVAQKRGDRAEAEERFRRAEEEEARRPR